MRRLALHDDLRDEVAEAAGLDRVVGRLEDDHEIRLGHARDGAEEIRQRALRRRQLLAGEEQEADVDLGVDVGLLVHE